MTVEQLNLTAKQQKVLAMRLDGFTCREMTDRIDDRKTVSLQAVRQLSARAMKRLGERNRAAYLDALNRSRQRHVFRPIQLSLCV